MRHSMFSHLKSFAAVAFCGFALALTSCEKESFAPQTKTTEPYAETSVATTAQTALNRWYQVPTNALAPAEAYEMYYQIVATATPAEAERMYHNLYDEMAGQQATEQYPDTRTDRCYKHLYDRMAGQEIQPNDTTDPERLYKDLYDRMMGQTAYEQTPDDRQPVRWEALQTDLLAGQAIQPNK